MSSQETFSIEQAVSYGCEQLTIVSDSAKLDSQILLAHVLGKPTTYLYTWPEQVLQPDEIKRYFTLIESRVAGEPIAYLVGSKEFWSLDLKVSPATLIPRPDTEVLVETVIEHHKNSSLACLDLGTGTGAIALALSTERPNWKIDAIDYSDEAVLLAKQNAQLHHLTQVNIFQSDWFKNIDVNKKYEIIVSNPPYIDPLDCHLEEGDVRFEPRSALVAENKGLADIELIIKYAKNYLATNGTLYFEHGFDQAEAVKSIFFKYGYQNIKTIKDYNGNDRITFACYNPI